MDNNTILVLVAIVTCFVALASWLGKRDNKNIGDAEWKGAINAKLDMILGITNAVEAVEEKVDKNIIHIVELTKEVEGLTGRIDRYKVFCDKQQETKLAKADE